MTDSNQLSSAQKTFIALVSTWIDPQAIGRKLNLIWEKDRKCARLGDNELAINLTDNELLDLASLGYLELYLSSSPQAIIFKEPIFRRETGQKQSGEPHVSSKKIVEMDIRQVYVWLGASVVFAMIAIILLVITINALLANKITSTVASGIITLVTTIAAAVFFRNYDKANERLKRFRENAPDQGDEKQ
jgi:hypothetical protein